MADLGTKEVYDVSDQVEAVDDGSGNYDVKMVSGDDRVGQLVLRGYFTAPGEIHTDPEWGAHLSRYKSEPARTSQLQDIQRTALRFIGDVDGVEDAGVIISMSSSRAYHIRTRVQTNGRDFLIPEVLLG